jgi:cell division septation protein DedD
MILFVVLAKQPYRIVDWCKSAGFTKCTVLGAEYERSAVDAEQRAGELKAQIAAVAAESEALKKDIQSKLVSAPPEVKRELQAQAQAVSTAVGQIEVQAEKNLRATSAVVDQVATDGNWAVVFGGFPEFARANEKVSKAKQAGIENARVFLRNYDGKVAYRSVALFTNRDAARQAVNTVNAFSSRKDAYLVNFDNWCKGRRDVVHEKYGDVSECQ